MENKTGQLLALTILALLILVVPPQVFSAEANAETTAGGANLRPAASCPPVEAPAGPSPRAGGAFPPPLLLRSIAQLDRHRPGAAATTVVPAKRQH